jgi:tetratricopeptide (TPR) repeat protein
MKMLYGRCPALFRMDGVPPYVLWNEVVKDYLQNCTPEQLYKVIGYYPAEVCKLVPEVRQKLGTFPQSLPISPEHERDRLFEAVSQLIINISKEAPLLVVLDDLQWTDQSSILLLHYLSRGVNKESLLVLGDYRDTDIDEAHALTPVLTEMNRERLLQSIQLKRMSLNDISEMIRQILEQDEVPKEFCERVYEKTRGNPFFAEEVVKSLKEEGVIYCEGNKWKVKEVSSIEFPKTVKSVVKARVSRLDDECRNVLTIASFIGNDFTFEALAGATGVEEDKLLELLEKMLKTELVKEKLVRGEDVFSFSDIIVRDVVHGEVSLLRHKKLHNTVGCALEKVYAKNIEEHLGELAYHFVEGGDKTKALNYFLKAGQKAAKIYANREAISYFESALKLLEEKEEERQERACVLERLGDIRNVIGEYDDCLKCWNDALQLFEQLSDKAKIAGLHLKLANVLWNKVGDSAKAGEHHSRALKILEAQPESVELARLYEDMAAMVSMGATGNMTEALSWAEKALELAKRLNEYEVIARSTLWLGEISTWLGNRRKGFECAERALRIALDNGYTETALVAYNDLALYYPPEQNEKSFECCKKGYELAKKAGDTYMQSWNGRTLGFFYFGRGDMSRATALLEESAALDRRTGNRTELCFSLDGLGHVHRTTGNWDKAEQFYSEALNLSEKLDDFQSKSASYFSMGLLALEKGEYAKAKGFFEKAAEVHEKHGARASQMNSQLWVIWTCIELAEFEEAENLLRSLQKFATETGEKERIANADIARAMLCRAQKKWAESIELFEKGLQEWEALGARQWNVYWFAKVLLYEYARAYLERDQEGDREKAHSLLNQAMEIFQKMGAKKDIERIIAKKKLLTA